MTAVASVAAVPVTGLLAIRSGDSVWSRDVFPLGSLLGATYGAVAVVLIRKAPANLVARLLCVVAAGFSWSELTAAYAERASSQHRVTSGCDVASWLATWLWVPAFASCSRGCRCSCPTAGCPPTVAVARVGVRVSARAVGRGLGPGLAVPRLLA